MIKFYKMIQGKLVEQPGKVCKSGGETLPNTDQYFRPRYDKTGRYKGRRPTCRKHEIMNRALILAGIREDDHICGMDGTLDKEDAA